MARVKKHVQIDGDDLFVAPHEWTDEERQAVREYFRKQREGTDFAKRAAESQKWVEKRFGPANRKGMNTRKVG